MGLKMEMRIPQFSLDKLYVNVVLHSFDYFISCLGPLCSQNAQLIH